ncbi:hypothetical protein [Leptospira fletcheri]|nr:hypothetical protein [Leptospira fletcheri]
MDGQVLALGSVSFALLALFGFVVRTNLERKSESSEVPKEVSPEEIPESPELPKDFSKPSEIETVSDLSQRSYFHLPVKGKIYESIRDFLDSLSEYGSWEIQLFSQYGKLSRCASKQRSLIVLSEGFPEAVVEESDGLTWVLEWEGSEMGKVVCNGLEDGGESREKELSRKIHSFAEALALSSKTEDFETGWGSYLAFCNALEKERKEGEEPKILLFLEFASIDERSVLLKSFGRWWSEKFHDSILLYRIRGNRAASFLSTSDWISFQKSLPSLMEFLGSPKRSLNVGAGVRVRKDDRDWEPKAREALYLSLEEGPNRLVCL